VDFIADLHLHAGEPDVAHAWQRYLLGTPADAVFILGDLFEVWAGDDAALPRESFAFHCGQVLHAAAARAALYFMPGNRDFLVGPAFLQQAQVHMLPDPTALAFAGRRWLLSHGDALCLADTEYQQFRALVRSQPWQAQMLARPLAEREAVARQMRAHSTRHQHADDYQSADVDTAAAIAWLRAARAGTLIHGHTHRPADHVLAGSGNPPLRCVALADWQLQDGNLHAQVLRLDADGLQRLLLAEAIQ
jgi:UDP-2,3-diacylglucosamine hydrolase